MGIFRELRHQLRALAKAPGFTLVAVITLALGIGANTAIFSVVNRVLLSPLPYPDSDELVYLWQTEPEIPVMSLSYPDYEDWRERNRSFEHLAVFRRARVNLTGSGEPRELRGAQVSANLFTTLGVQPQLGRGFRDEEDRPGSADSDIVVLAHGLWTNTFGGDERILGRTIALNGKPHLVVGVMPNGFAFPSGVELWVPVGPSSADPGWANRGNHPGLYGVGRLEPDKTLDQARADMADVTLALEQQYPATNTDVGATLTPLRELAVRGVRPALLTLTAAVGLVLLIACANVMNLMLSRAASRRREVAIRAALGASRSRMVGMLLSESALLSLAGGGLGLVLAWWGLDALTAVTAGSLPAATVIAVDLRVLAFTVAVSLVTALLFGLLPALQGTGHDLNGTLRDSDRATSGGRRTRRLRNLLVVGEVALALVLLVGAGLMTRSFIELSRVEPGFDRENLLTVRLALPEGKYPDVQTLAGFFDPLLERLGALPGVEHVALTSNLPFVDGSQTGFAVSGRPVPGDTSGPMADYAKVSADYFAAMGTPLLRGRTFDERDREQAPRVVIIDDSLARAYFQDQDPIGQMLTDGGEDTPESRATIVGVVGSVRLADLHVAPPRPQIYFPYTQSRPLQTTVLVRGAGDPSGLAAAVRRAVVEIDPEQPVSQIQAMETIVSGSLAPWRLNMILLGIFSVTAALLAAVGIYGVISYMVAQRTQEIGIRMALGARRTDVLRLVLRHGLALTAIGITVGVLAALGLTRLLASLLYGVRPTDPRAFTTVALLLAATALVACWIPALRATRLDPMIALREE